MRGRRGNADIPLECGALFHYSVCTHYLFFPITQQKHMFTHLDLNKGFTLPRAFFTFRTFTTLGLKKWAICLLVGNWMRHSIPANLQCTHRINSRLKVRVFGESTMRIGNNSLFFLKVTAYLSKSYIPASKCSWLCGMALHQRSRHCEKVCKAIQIRQVFYFELEGKKSSLYLCVMSLYKIKARYKWASKMQSLTQEDFSGINY